MPSKGLTAAEKRQRAKTNAIPDVKKLVKKHGRVIVQSCLNSIREHEVKVEKLETLKGEVEALEKEV